MAARRSRFRAERRCALIARRVKAGAGLVETAELAERAGMAEPARAHVPRAGARRLVWAWAAAVRQRAAVVDRFCEAAEADWAVVAAWDSLAVAWAVRSPFSHSRQPGIRPRARARADATQVVVAVPEEPRPAVLAVRQAEARS